MVYPVDSKYLKKIYDSIWMKNWEEEGYELEFSGVNPFQFLYTNKKGLFSGTLELKFKSEILSLFPFCDYLPKTAKLLEIDKLSILKNQRSDGVLDDILTTILLVAEKYNIDYNIAFIEPVFCRALKIAYKIPVIELGESFFYKGDNVIPIAIHTKEIVRLKHNYSWLKNESIISQILFEEKVELRVMNQS